MGYQGEHNLAHLERRIKELGEQLGAMGDISDLEETIFLLHQPGWTTPAEYLLVSGIVDTMQEHARALTTLRQSLITGSRLISEQAEELNPQPLPPGPEELNPQPLPPDALEE
jgi:hypothetical protein